LELGLMDGWIRYWWKGELLPLPAEMQDALSAALRDANEAKRRAELSERTIRELQEKLARLEARKNGTSGSG